MVGVDRTRKGKPAPNKVAANRKACEEAFNKGWGVLYAAEQIPLNKNTVSSYYIELREEMVDKMDNNFINEQRVGRAMAIKKLDDAISGIEVIMRSAQEKLNSESPAFHNTVIKCMEVKAEFEQARYALDMAPTTDVPIEWIIKHGRDKIDSLTTGLQDTK